MTKWFTHKINKEVILSKGFLLALVTLILNDYLLKEMFSNLITGKLSDFSGVFLFVLFLSSISSLSTKQTGWATVVIFTYWKSPLSTPLINFWNLYFPDVTRVVDYYDLTALIMIPLALFYIRNIQNRDDRKLFLLPVLLSATFAITGSSCTHKSPIYTVDLTSTQQVSLLKKMDELANKEGWLCKSCEVGKTVRVYKTPLYNIYANYDDSSSQLFYQVGGAVDNPEYMGEVKNKIESFFKNEDVLVAIESSGKTWARTNKYFNWYVSMKGSSQGDIGTKIKNFFPDAGENEELNKVFQFVSDYFMSRGYLPKSYQATKNPSLFYDIGHALGADERDTSTHISVGLRGGWLVTHFYAEISQYKMDSSIPAKDMAMELEKKLRNMVSKDIEVEFQFLP